jgi:hypothetical protein
MEIPKAYDPKLAEEQHYSRWGARLLRARN